VVVIVETKEKNKTKQTTPMNIVSVVYIYQSIYQKKHCCRPLLLLFPIIIFLSNKSMIIGIFAKQKWPILIAEKCDE